MVGSAEGGFGEFAREVGRFPDIENMGWIGGLCLTGGGTASECCSWESVAVRREGLWGGKGA